jgi:single-strand DNA-binding protein
MPYSNINRVVLVGRLTRDPELRSLPSGVALCRLRIACNSLRKQPDGSYSEKPNFFNVNVFGASAESVSRYTAKGRLVALDGRLEWSEWEVDEGQRRQAVDIVAERVQFLERPAGEALGAEEEAGDRDPGDEPGRELVGVGSGIEDELAF